ncbi:hypothetical protein BKN38_08055 [Helicobacter sp. CLO-3]|uniref:3-methyladenine DNA glycosylase n=1 Tax=unclassified Helicobacter TaxID=2593540 RepID=UPI000804B93E|nr:MULTISPECIES: 3-methyladenine DNA glycosylase [unclassified Helicobacter]OBV28379.1 hypothetical protein BA723_09640 [Helicobacter sp. CLO-3]OHU81905.1 hypothetical protein BKN38_08055 [Helicobacter sp. CLO-3]
MDSGGFFDTSEFLDIDSFALLCALKSMDLLADSAAWWWPSARSFEVVIGAILTQNTKWEGVQKSLENLKNAGILSDDSDKSLESIARATTLETLIAPSGLYRQKSARIIALARAILDEFGSFDEFALSVSREWLLRQKGVGFESADAILNYACGREIMVIDAYTARLIASLGCEMSEYDAIQAWCMDMPRKSLEALYPGMPLAQIYARYHGKIVEFSKKKGRAKEIIKAIKAQQENASLGRA